MKKYLVTLIVFFGIFAFAQVDRASDLYKTILSKDSLLFDVGFNTCDVKQYEILLADDFKFYHDKGGISDKKKFIFDFKNGLCRNSEPYSKRVLDKKSIEIFPLYNNNVLYGAIQNGRHLFYEKNSEGSGIAKFSNVWVVENNVWKLSSSLSFDHQAKQKKSIKK